MNCRKPLLQGESTFCRPQLGGPAEKNGAVHAQPRASKRQPGSECHFALVPALRCTSLISPAIDDGPAIRPVAQSTGGINMSALTDPKVLGAPGCNSFLSVRRRRIGVIVAADYCYSILA
jgi:hypothetical protein